MSASKIAAAFDAAEDFIVAMSDGRKPTDVRDLLVLIREARLEFEAIGARRGRDVVTPRKFDTPAEREAYRLGLKDALDATATGLAKSARVCREQGHAHTALVLAEASQQLFLAAQGET